ncbi:MAG TPA: hypothetical protein VLA59_07835 [Patescibacteria group bacterium]|nr:hypothetical protein [Patescibacteria group bacterium]
MTERGALLRRAAPALLLALLAIALVVPATDALRLSSTDGAPVDRWNTALDALPAEPTVLVAHDPDLGTYAEIRPTVRAAVADLMARDARLAFVSLTPEGRALLVAELARLEREVVNPARMLDLGFVPGAEAALVSLAAGPAVPDAAAGAIARSLVTEGVAAIDALLVVGGNDLGPRSWIEQFTPRVGDLPVLAITPTVLLPEIQPYLDSGQLDAALTTPRDGAGYRAGVALGPLERLREPVEPPALGVLVGLLVAIAALGQGWAARIGTAVRGASREHERP